MSKADEPAFGHGDFQHGGAPGMTYRQWLEGIAMQGLCACAIPGAHRRPEELADEALRCADALIKLQEARDAS